MATMQQAREEAVTVAQPQFTMESWNEWDSLREVIVGSLEGKVAAASPEPAVKRKLLNYDLYKFPLSSTFSTRDKLMAAAETCLDGFVERLKEEGINVLRPTPFDFSQQVSTPNWSAQQSGCTCPRDLFFIAGKHMVEAPMSWRCRYFEHVAFRDVMMGYYLKDRSLRWSAAPKPLLLDSSYNLTAASRPLEEVSILNREVLFDAADVRRFGKDIFVQEAHTANALGRDWIARTLTPDGFRVHQFGFEDDWSTRAPSFVHIDAKVTPVEEGMLLWTAGEEPCAATRKMFEANDWNLLECPARETCVTELDQTGPGLHLNMLALGGGVACVEASETRLIKFLRTNLVDVIPVPFAPCYPFGGGLNCFTLDTHRQGPANRSYFPLLDREAERKVVPEVAAQGLGSAYDSWTAPTADRQPLHLSGARRLRIKRDQDDAIPPPTKVSRTAADSLSLNSC